MIGAGNTNSGRPIGLFFLFADEARPSPVHFHFLRFVPPRHSVPAWIHTHRTMTLVLTPRQNQLITNKNNAHAQARASVVQYKQANAAAQPSTNHLSLSRIVVTRVVFFVSRVQLSKARHTHPFRLRHISTARNRE